MVVGLVVLSAGIASAQFDISKATPEEKASIAVIKDIAGSKVTLTPKFLVDLGDTLTMDSGLEHLKGLSKLEQLSLDYTLITDAGLAHLEGLTGLKVLYLIGTGVERLQAALPDCKITR